jgi:hypothetical protein
MSARQKRNNIVYAEVVERLLRSVPEVTGAYTQEQLKWGSERVPPDVAYGSIFCGFLRQIVIEGTREAGHSQSDIIRRSFQLIEELALSWTLALYLA